MHLLFLLLTVGALIISVRLVMRGSPGLLMRIQLALTTLFFIAFVADWRFAMWLHAMAYPDPTRQYWEIVLAPYCDAAWFAIFISWLTFSAAHAVVIFARKAQARR